MTDDEHHTRAMLLGMDFIAHLHAYRKLSGTTAKANDYIDATTMEPIPPLDVLHRIRGDMDADNAVMDEKLDFFLAQACDDILG